MQNLIRSNGIPSLANGLKSLKQRLDSVGAKINEGKKNKPISAETVKQPAKVETTEVKKVPEAQPVSVAKNSDESKAQPQRQNVQRQDNPRFANGQNGGYQRNNQGGYQGGQRNFGQNGYQGSKTGWLCWWKSSSGQVYTNR